MHGFWLPSHLHNSGSGIEVENGQAAEHAKIRKSLVVK